MVLLRRHRVRFGRPCAANMDFARRPALAVATGQVLRGRLGFCSSPLVHDREHLGGPRVLTRSRRTLFAGLGWHSGGAWTESMVRRVCLVSMVLVWEMQVGELDSRCLRSCR